MRTNIIAFLFVLCIICLTGCKGSVFKAKIDYGNSSIYSKDDMNAAIMLIKKEFREFENCELHSIEYSDDSYCNLDNIAWMNELEAANGNKAAFTQCIMFKSSFHTPKREAGAWEKDEEYTDWEWWLARSQNGEWKLMTSGY